MNKQPRFTVLANDRGDENGILVTFYAKNILYSLITHFYGGVCLAKILKKLLRRNTLKLHGLLILQFFAEGVNLVLVHSEGVNTILLISRKTFLSTYLSFFLTVLLVLEIHWD